MTLALNNKERLKRDIVSLIQFISNGRNFFFQQTGFSIESSDNWLDHWTSKELFNKYPELVQLELNIYLLYIKLSSYYKLTINKPSNNLSTIRNSFAHELTSMIFHRKISYNFFLHKVTENFKMIQFIFYDENGADGNVITKNIDINLHEDINNFFQNIS